MGWRYSSATIRISAARSLSASPRVTRSSRCLRTTIAAGTFLFLLPVAIFTFLLRSHLLRGVTFGAIRK